LVAIIAKASNLRANPHCLAGAPHAGLHDLRHLHATTLLSSPGFQCMSWQPGLGTLTPP
jgi:hypothetical protein